MAGQEALLPLDIKGVHKSYGPHEVLKGISLRAKRGDVISLIGSSGSGKSTFLRCINFLEIPDSGSFVINGETIRLKPGRDGRAHPADMRQIERVRAGLGMVFQNFNLWPHMTVLENVIEAPVFKSVAGPKPSSRPRRFSPKSGSMKNATPIRPSCLVANSSAPRLRGRCASIRR